MVELICEASVSQLSKLKSCRRAPPLPLCSQDGAHLGRVVFIVLHCIFLPFAVRHPGTFSALNSAGSVSVYALSTESQSSKCTSARFETELGSLIFFKIGRAHV